VAGIGNGYADEVLWEARLAPLRTRSSLAPDEVDALYHAIRTVMPWAIEQLRARVPPRYEVEVRDFLRVHRKGGTPCPRCGTTISEISPGGFVTSWCRTCQR
jgi:formamidopyrimidine-DNA glycosylase